MPSLFSLDRHTSVNAYHEYEARIIGMPLGTNLAAVVLYTVQSTHFVKWKRFSERQPGYSRKEADADMVVLVYYDQYEGSDASPIVNYPSPHVSIRSWCGNSFRGFETLSSGPSLAGTMGGRIIESDPKRPAFPTADTLSATSLATRCGRKS